MEFFDKFNFKPSHVLKTVGVVVLAVIVLLLVVSLISTSVNSLRNAQTNSAVAPGAPAYFSGGYESAQKVSMDSSLSIRNVASSLSPMPPRPTTGTTGDTAENFEVTDYSANIETRSLKNTCATVADLKARDYVIFENASEFDHGCNYTFKVKKDKVSEILGIIKGLSPKELSANTYTIKQMVDDFTSQVDILQKKLDSIDETLKKAVAAYNDVTNLATQVKDVESLAKIIDSKINIIERLTQERINVNSQLEQIGRTKAEQLDRLNYTYFHINVFENKFIDGQALKDSWQTAIKAFVQDINNVAQDMTINLVVVLLVVFQYAVYLLIIVVVAKYGWQLVRYIWHK